MIVTLYMNIVKESFLLIISTHDTEIWPAISYLFMDPLYLQHTNIHILEDHPSWSAHVTNVAKETTRMLNFLKHHLSKCSSNVKTSTYLMVRPLMEYTCVARDLHYQSQVSCSLRKGSKACSKMSFV